MLNLIDEFTRECLAIHPQHRLNSRNVIEVVANAMVEHGVPEHIRSDNGTEFVAKDLRKWLADIGTETLYVEAGSPWQNGYCETFNLRDEFLNNTVRPRSSLGYRPSARLFSPPPAFKFKPETLRSKSVVTSTSTKVRSSNAAVGEASLARFEMHYRATQVGPLLIPIAQIPPPRGVVSATLPFLIKRSGLGIFNCGRFHSPLPARCSTVVILHVLSALLSELITVLAFPDTAAVSTNSFLVIHSDEPVATSASGSITMGGLTLANSI
jgi:hypothetical protein